MLSTVSNLIFKIICHTEDCGIISLRDVSQTTSLLYTTIKRGSSILKEIIRNYRIPHLSSGIYSTYYGGLTPCVFDIETTGLSARKGGKVILTALLIPTPEGISVTQYLAEGTYEEDRILRATLRFLADNNVDFLVTYNGTSFDLPFVNRRLEALHFPCSLKLHHLDLYSWIKRSTVLPSRISSLSQKSVEKYFRIGNDRVDAISGKESAKLYSEYATGHSSVIEKIILTHNREDVVQLYRLLRRFFCTEPDALSEILRTDSVHEAQAAYGYPLLLKAELTIRPKVSGKALLLQGIQHCNLKEMLASSEADADDQIFLEYKYHYRENALPHLLNARVFSDLETPFSAEFHASTENYRISLPLEQYAKSSYIDLTRLHLDFSEAQKNTLSACRGFVNDYLILVEDGRCRYPDINIFAEILAGRILERVRDL